MKKKEKKFKQSKKVIWGYVKELRSNGEIIVKMNDGKEVVYK